MFECKQVAACSRITYLLDCCMHELFLAVHVKFPIDSGVEVILNTARKKCEQLQSLHKGAKQFHYIYLDIVV